MTGRIGMLGFGGAARAFASYLAPGTDVFWAVTSDHLEPGRPDLIDITSPEPLERASAVLGAVGAPGLRRKMIGMWPGDRFATVVSDRAHVESSCDMGSGTVVAPGAVISVNVIIGEHSQVNIGATVSHDSRLGTYVTVCPGADIGGEATLSDGVFIGIGAIVSNNVTLAPGVVVGAGATVLSDVLTPNSVVVGTPAKTVKVREDWLNAV